MRFREINEIKNKEIRKDTEKKEEGYKKIKPETDITVEEALAFFDTLFEQMRLENKWYF